METDVEAAALHVAIREAMVQASDQLKWTSDYIGRFNLSEFKREAEMALEMSALIMEKAELNKQVAALPSKS